ncbi:flagellar basal body-associated FliL family protein [Thetidibacter halocola]|uniref:Flagellar protein FliL n=1 Tax=Thetidibacter halocola TaxID=2827239 RepID=A0A8J7WFA2_9RHOB|nr:flagellar basal body-associated FliL family protein [Thetidibacter halocola]MBS0125742.1 flagellar basal body-associated FliL family protein [Thetidibacter halocola]
MTDATVDDTATKAGKPSRLPLIIGLVLAIAGGGGGFYAVQSGLLGGASPHAEEAEHAAEDLPETGPLPDVAFVEVPPVTITLGQAMQAGHLRFRASLEVPKAHEQEVLAILPRVQDVMNTYLRALQTEDLQQAAALVRIRAQLLRRIKLVVGEGRVQDLLILDFVLN